MKTQLITPLVFATAMAVAAPASALDAYKDRRGLFAGVSFGGGAATASADDGRTGLDDDRLVGMAIGFTAGGGASQQLVLAAEATWWTREVASGTERIKHNQLGLLALARYFVLDGIFVEAGGGLGRAAFDAERDDTTVSHVKELGLAGRLGAGYEVFMNGDLSVGFGLNYTGHFYEASQFDSLNGAILLRWY